MASSGPEPGEVRLWTDDPSVLVAVAEPSVGRRLSDHLGQNGLNVRALASEMGDAVELAAAEEPDLCIIDVALPGGGLDTVTAISRESPRTRILLLGETDGGQAVCDAIVAGARGYAVKPVAPEVIHEQLHRLLRGEPAVSHCLMVRLIDELQRRERSRERRRQLRDLLTERELDVLELLSQGLVTRQIAERLFVSPVTVRSHIASAMRKLDVADRETLVARYERSLH